MNLSAAPTFRPCLLYLSGFCSVHLLREVSGGAARPEPAATCLRAPAAARRQNEGNRKLFVFNECTIVNKHHSFSFFRIIYSCFKRTWIFYFSLSRVSGWTSISGTPVYIHHSNYYVCTCVYHYDVVNFDSQIVSF